VIAVVCYHTAMHDLMQPVIGLDSIILLLQQADKRSASDLERYKPAVQEYNSQLRMGRNSNMYEDSCRPIDVLGPWTHKIARLWIVTKHASCFMNAYR
jgi:hypothetical protein